MEMPALLSEELKYAEVAENDHNLLNMLVKIPSDFIRFFECAVEDETWSENHDQFMKGAIIRFTNQFFKDRLLPENAARVAAGIRQHYALLNKNIQRDLVFRVEGEDFAFNSLLFGTASEFLRDFIRDKFRDRDKKIFELNAVDKSVFLEIEEFANTGAVTRLWKKSPEEVLEALRQADEWGIVVLGEMAQDILKRYVEKDNVVEHLLRAHANRWRLLKDFCIDYIDEQGIGVLLHKGNFDELVFEFKNFREDALNIFEAVREEITHLIVSGSLTDKKEFSDVINRTPRLMSLSLRGSVNFSDRLMDIDESLKELRADRCSWVNRKTLKRLIEICPHLESLSLSGNVQLRYSDWALLDKLEKLRKLDISFCHQVTDSDFDIILSASPRLSHLNIAGCRELTDSSFYAIGKQLPRLTDLDLSRLNISDPALIDIASNKHDLYALTIIKCGNITDKGILEVVEVAPSLRVLVLSRTAVSASVIDKIRAIKPALNVSLS